MPQREKMTRRDFAMYRMDSDKNLMVINNVFLVEGELNFPDLLATIARRLLAYPRFVRKVVTEKGGGYWQEDENFNIASHVMLRTCERDMSEEQLQDEVSLFAQIPFSPERPLWSMTVFDRVCGGYAIVFRFHHCISDGFGLTHIFNHLTDDAVDNMVDPVFDLYRQEAGRALKKGRSFLGEIFFWFQVFAIMTKLSFLLPDPKTRLKKALSGNKKLIWSPLLEVAPLKLSARKLGVSLNDLWMTAVAGGLRQYLAENAQSIDAAALRSVATYNLRDPKDAYQLGNEFALVAVDLPSHLANPMRRLQYVHQAMAIMKQSLQPQATMSFASMLGWLPCSIQHVFMHLFTSKASVVLSNLQGPTGRRYLAGSRVKSHIGWVPQANGIGVGLAFLSYAGQIRISLGVDENLISNPQHLMKLTLESFSEICGEASLHEVEPIAA